MIILFLGSTYNRFDDYHNMRLQFSFTSEQVNLVDFIRKHATLEQISKLNNNTRENIEEIREYLKIHEQNII